MSPNRTLSKIGFIFGLFVSVILSSCSSRCCDFGRPSVLCSQSKWIIDYNECFIEMPLHDAACIQTYAKAPLSEDMFDPYEPIDSDYRLARGDILEVSIFGEEETKLGNAMVAPDGKLYYTVVEGIQAEGRTPEEVAREIESKLEGLFRHPLVVVNPKLTESLAFHVLGRVKKPGQYLFTGPLTLREGIAEAGGLLVPVPQEEDQLRRYLVPYVNLRESFIVRENKKLDVDFEKLLYEGDSSQDIYLRPGDYVYLSGEGYREIFVLGSVNIPQRVTYTPNMTLMAALANVSGWPTPNPYSPNLEKVIVIRGNLDCPRVCEVDVNQILAGYARDLYLEPGDIVYASYKKFRFGRELALLAIESFLDGFVGGAGEHYTRFHWWGEDEEEEMDTEEDDVDD